jgi:hypothetical protein
MEKHEILIDLHAVSMKISNHYKVYLPNIDLRNKSLPLECLMEINSPGTRIIHM